MTTINGEDWVRKDFDVLLDLAQRLIRIQAEVPLSSQDPCLNDAQVLGIKMFRHLIAMRGVAQEVVVTKDDEIVAHHIDHSSTKVLARAAYETFLVFSFIFRCQPQVGLFRHNAWRLGGLSDRQEFEVKSEEGRRKLQVERAQIEELQKSIVAHREYESYSEKGKKKLLDGDWRIGKSWNDLAEIAGFERNFSRQVYSYFCGYSHSSYLSVLQISQARTFEEQQMLSHTSFDIANSILGHFAKAYCEIFPSTEPELYSNPVALECARRWQMRSSPQPNKAVD
jgi:hypothetical protein